MLYKLEMNDEVNQVMAYLTKFAEEELIYLAKVEQGDETEKTISGAYTNELLRYMDQTLGFALQSDTGDNGITTFSIDSAVESTVNRMFTLLTNYVTPGEELVKREGRKLTYSKLVIATGDENLIRVMKDAREAENKSLTEILSNNDNELQQLIQAMESDVITYGGKLSRDAIEDNYEKNYPLMKMYFKRNAIRQLDGLTPLETVTNIPPVGVGPIGPVPQDLNPVTETISQQ